MRPIPLLTGVLLDESDGIADTAVAPEELVEQLCNIFDNDILFGMADTQVLASQALSVTVDHHGDGQIAGHPAITEHSLDVAGL